MPESAPVHFKTAAAFRRWLRQNHQTATELVVLIRKKHAARLGLTYADALDEALAHGWIDGVKRSIDPDTFSSRFSPRKARSIWSRINVAHVERLRKAGRMTPAGEAVYALRDEKRTGIYSFERAAMTLSADLEKRFRAHRKAWTYFRAQPPGYQRLNVFRVMSAKRAETRLRRLDNLIEHSAKGIRLTGA